MGTQAERRHSTQTRLLDAASACLVESGYAALTTTAVAQRAGLSQGALFRYFPSKPDLLAATVEHLFAALTARYEARFSKVAAAGGATVSAAIGLLADVLDDPRYLAALELHTAARTDARLRASLDSVVHRHGENLRRLAYGLPLEPGAGDRQLLDDLIDLATLALQGAAVHRMAVHETRAPRRVIAALTRLAGLARAAQPNRLATNSPRPRHKSKPRRGLR